MAILAGLVGFGAAHALRLFARQTAPAVDPTAVLRKERLELFVELPATPQAVVMAGDSIVARGEWRELLDDPRVRNRGLPGERVGDLELRLPSLVEGPPAILVLWVGINDLMGGEPPEKVAAAYENALVALRASAPRVRVLVLSVLPVAKARVPELSRRSAVDELNALLQTRVGRHGSTYVDLARTVAGADGTLSPPYTTDGVHLSGRGYRAVAQVLAPFLQ